MAASKNTVPDNMKIYESHRAVPQEALKPILAGRLKGMSDINPMWRIKALTEEFGPCGIGWYYTVDQQWLEPSGNETVAFVNISLYVKVNGEWSQPIFGTGGSKFVSQERNGAYVNDEAYKMAITDSIGVAAKQLGIAADIYYAKDRSKYDLADDENAAPQKKETTKKADAAPKAEQFTGMNPPEEEVDKDLIPEANKTVTPDQIAKLQAEMDRTGVSLKQVLSIAKVDSIEKVQQVTFTAIMTKFSKTRSKEG